MALGSGAIGVYTWAGKPAANVLAAGDLFWIKDVGAARNSGFRRTLWMGDGADQRLFGDQYLLFDTTPAVAASFSTSEQIVKQFVFPAGLLMSLRGFAIRALWTKSGTTDTMTTYMRLGTAGTVADPRIYNTTDTLIFSAGANRTQPTDSSYFAASATTLRKLAGQADTANMGYNGAVSSGAYGAFDTTVADMSANALTLSLSVKSSGTTDKGGVAHLLIVGF